MMRRKSLALGLGLILCWLFLLGSFCYPHFVQAGDAFIRTNYELGLRFGYGHTTTVRESLNFYSWLPRVGVFLTGPHNPILGRLRLSLVLEGLIGAIKNHNSGWDLGLTPLLKLSYPFTSRLLGYLEGGVGVIWENIDSPTYAHTFNFSPQAGAGVDLRLVGNLALSLAYRYRHTSNASLYAENPGVNSHFAQLGFAYYF